MLKLVALIKAEVERRIAATQKRYKNNHDNKARWEPQILIVNEVYLDRPQNAAFVSDSAEQLAQREYYKLIERRSGAYKVTEVQSNAVLIDEEGILNIVAIERMTPGQKSAKVAKQTINRDNKPLVKTAPTPDHITKDERHQRDNKDKKVEDYVVSRIPRHV